MSFSQNKNRKKYSDSVDDDNFGKNHYLCHFVLHGFCCCSWVSQFTIIFRIFTCKCITNQLWIFVSSVSVFEKMDFKPSGDRCSICIFRIDSNRGRFNQLIFFPSRLQQLTLSIRKSVPSGSPASALSNSFLLSHTDFRFITSWQWTVFTMLFIFYWFSFIDFSFCNLDRSAASKKLWIDCKTENTLNLNFRKTKKKKKNEINNWWWERDG